MSEPPDPRSMSEGNLKIRQAKEREQLQAEIQQLKKAASKGDKKKKQEVSAKIALLEAKLDEQHEEELSSVQQDLRWRQETCAVAQDSGTVGLAEKIEHLDISSNSKTAAIEPRKPSRAQKRKEKKALECKSRNLAIEEQELLNRQGSRHLENELLKEMLNQRGLELVNIPADGDCLYKAVQDQMHRLGQSWSVEKLRQSTANYMRQHCDMFLPFMVDDAGQPMAEDAFAAYCRKVETTSEWGGQLEMCALSHILRRPLEVIQAEGGTHVIGEEYAGNESIMLVYHRHLYGLGEHYSSTATLGSSAQLVGSGC